MENSNINPVRLNRSELETDLKRPRQQFLIRHMLFFAVIWATWLWLYGPVLRYFSDIFTRADFRLNQILLLAIIGLIIQRLWSRSPSIGWNWEAIIPIQTPLPLFPLSLMGISSLGYLLAERFLDINTLSAILFGVATYGLAGLWLPQRRWWRGLPAALLLIGTLPFNAHLETFLGYPLRIMTAEVVAITLTEFGFAPLSRDTILVFENGISQVDVPCSGVKSLWTGALFMLAVIWIEERRLHLRRLIEAVFFALLLVLVNLIRVGILVTVGEALRFPLFAEMLHVPLGVLGFVFACAALLFIMRFEADQPDVENGTADTRPGANGVMHVAHSPQNSSIESGLKQSIIRRDPTPISLLLLLFIILCGLFYQPRTLPVSPQTAADWQYPQSLQTEAEPLAPDALAWLQQDGAERIERVRFTHGEQSGSMLLISSRTWRAHHRPENCFKVYGLDINDSRTHLVTADTPIRSVVLGSQEHDLTLNAVYWYQSADKITDDHGVRVWSDTVDNGKRWVLVSILFDEPIEPGGPDVQEMVLAVSEEVGKWLNDDT